MVCTARVGKLRLSVHSSGRVGGLLGSRYLRGLVLAKVMPVALRTPRLHRDLRAGILSLVLERSCH